MATPSQGLSSRKRLIEDSLSGSRRWKIRRTSAPSVYLRSQDRAGEPGHRRPWLVSSFEQAGRFVRPVATLRDITLAGVAPPKTADVSSVASGTSSFSFSF
jgi:hypothetical protein